MGEFLSSRFEFLDYMNRYAVDVLQPDVGRPGGSTEARRVANLARDRGLIVVPQGWKTTFTVPEPKLTNGRFELPSRAGLGVEFNEQAVQSYTLRRPRAAAGDRI